MTPLAKSGQARFTNSAFSLFATRRHCLQGGTSDHPCPLTSSFYPKDIFTFERLSTRAGPFSMEWSESGCTAAFSESPACGLLHLATRELETSLPAAFGLATILQGCT